MALGKNMKKDKLIPEESAEIQPVTNPINNEISLELQGQQAALNNAAILSEVDLQGNILLANDLFCEISGYAREELIGKKQSIVRHPDMPGAVFDELWGTITRGKVWRGRVKNRTKQGGFYWVDATITPIIGENEKPVKYIGIRYDITKQVAQEEEIQRQLEEGRAKEEELRQNMEEMSATQEAMERNHLELQGQQSALNNAAIVSEVDLRGNILFVNDRFCEISGYNREELIGKKQSIVRHSDMPGAVFDELWGTITKGKVWRGRVKNSTKSGGFYWVEATITPVLGADGKPVKYIGVRFDITEQVAQEEEIQRQLEEGRAKEEELRQNMEEMSATQEAMERNHLELQGQQSALNNAAIVSEVDLRGNILFVNDRFCEISGYNREELIGKKQSIVRHPDMPGAVFDELWETITKGKVWNGRVKNRTKKGGFYWVEATITPVLGVDGKPVKYIGVRFDITEQVEQELEVKKQMQEMSSQMQAINSTSAFIEFNINGIIITANDLFLQTVGYSLEEIQGQHHRIFCENLYANSFEYQDFWKRLNNGESFSGEFKRIDKQGKNVWLQASYTPVKDDNGNVIKVIKLATNITEEKIKNADYQGQIQAVYQSNAFIEFNLDGTIIKANDLFLKTTGYSLHEIQGKHHRMFCESSYGQSTEYTGFWRDLNEGKAFSDKFQRIDKYGKEIWLQASYTPVKDVEGNIVKVIKLATDITEFTNTLNDIRQFVTLLKQGDFNQVLEANPTSDLYVMVQDLVSLKDNVKGIVEDIAVVVKQAGEEGDLSVRLDTKGTEGTWRNLTDLINNLLQSIVEPLMEFNAIVAAMAEGDLTRKFEMKAKGSIKQMGDSLNVAVENLSTILTSIEHSASIVANASNSMLDKNRSMKKSTSEVASAIAQMSKGAQDQAIRTDESSTLVDGVMQSSNVTAEKTNIINVVAEKGQKSCAEGMKIMKNLLTNMGDIQTSATSTSDSIEVLTQRAEEIGRTLNVITDIASQTNLLALNAAIEAARAGDAGRGFAVVAEEIRKLAEDSRRSAIDIEKIISDVQKDTQRAGKAIQEMEVSVKQGNTASKDAETIFSEIADSSNETVNFSKEIQIATFEQKGAIDLVVKNIEQIVVVAEETAAGSEEVASSAEELNHAMDEITTSSNTLSQVALELQEGVNRFVLRR